MRVPATRHHRSRRARIAGTVAAAVAASLLVLPGVYAVAAPAPGSATLTREQAETPAVVEVVVGVQDAEMVYGAAGELVASVQTVDGDPVTSGTVTFLLNGRTLSAVVVQGSATVPVTTEDFGSVHGYPLNHGGYWYRASFTGEGYTDADASAKLQVVPAEPVLEASVSPEAVPGDVVAIEGRITAQAGHEGQPQGSVHVVVDGAPLGDPVRVAEDGTFSTEFTAPESWGPGEHTVEVALPRHGNFTAATLTLTTTVSPAEVEVVVGVQDAEMVYGAAGELVASVQTVDGDPVTSGTVTFLLNGRTLSADVVQGSATVPVTTEDFGSVHGYPLNHGGYWYRASFTGEGYTDADASAKLHVTKAPVRLNANLDAEELEAGDTVALDGRVAALEGHDGQPQGNLHVLLDGAPLGDPIRVAEDGTFSTEVSIPQDWEPGRHTISLQYDESANFIEGSLQLDLTVVAPDDGPGSIWDALERMLRDLLDWLGSLFGGR